MLKKLTDKVDIFSVYDLVISVLFGVIILYLIILAGYSTSVVNTLEQTYLIKDNPITNLFILILFIELLVPFSRLAKNAVADPAFFPRYKKIILRVFVVIMVLYVFNARKQQCYDSAYIFDVAREWRRGIFDSMQPGGYAEAHTNNKGIILLIYLASYLVGSENYLFFQLLNVLFLALLYNALVKIAKAQKMSDAGALMLLLSCVLFLPLNLYAIFTYGLIMGLSCMVNALLYAVKYLDSKDYQHAIISVAFAFMGVLIKQNSVIMLLGLIFFVLISIMKNPSKGTIIFTLALLGVLILTNPVIKLVTDAITGTKTSGGIAMKAYIAMGLNEDSYLYPGWYNIYVDGSYSDANMSTELQQKAADELIKDKWKDFRNNPAYCLDYFSKKNASQWNNPDFESVWVMQYRETANPDYPKILTYLESVEGADLYNRVSNRIQFIILFGVAMYVILKRKKTEIELYYCMVVIGGFVFHTFWEAKSQYILPYFVLMLPLYVSGYVELLHLYRTSQNIFKEKRLVISFCVIFILYLTVWFDVSNNMTCIFNRTEDTERYEEYVRTPQEGFESPW